MAAPKGGESGYAARITAHFAFVNWTVWHAQP
jgi:hypothetical protein